MIRHLVARSCSRQALLWPESHGRRAAGSGPKLSGPEYEGWRQYSAHCARCHGQDVVGNPVAADLLKSAAAGGPVADAGRVRERS